MEHVDPFMGIILPYINFAIFVALCWYFFKKPIGSSTKQQKEAFDAALADANAAKLEADQRLADLDSRLSNLDAEIEDVKNVSKKTAEAEADKILSDAKALSERIREEAKRVGEAEVERARDSLRKEIIDSVRASVEEKIKSELSDDKHLALTKKKIEGLKDLSLEG